MTMMRFTWSACKAFQCLERTLQKAFQLEISLKYGRQKLTYVCQVAAELGQWNKQQPLVLDLLKNMLLFSWPDFFKLWMTDGPI